MAITSLPLSRDTDASVDTNGEAYAIPDGKTAPWIPAAQMKVYVSDLAFIGFSHAGTDDSPVPAATVDNTVYQVGDTEEVYTFGHFREQPTWLYVYAASTAILVRISFFG